MTQHIKLCGLSTPTAIAAAVAGGATHLGFIFFPKSPRNVSARRAGELAVGRGSARAVAVTVNASDEHLAEIVETMQPDILQLHGGESSPRVAEVKARFGLPVWKALAVRDASDLARAADYRGVADALLFDAKPPKGADLPGGNGVTFDWSLLDGFTADCPVLLSGGIGLDNLDEALAVVKNPSNAITGLDLSSGLESAPGVKDIAKIETFLQRVTTG